LIQKRESSQFYPGILGRGGINVMGNRGEEKSG